MQFSCPNLISREKEKHISNVIAICHFCFFLFSNDLNFISFANLKKKIFFSIFKVLRYYFSVCFSSCQLFIYSNSFSIPFYFSHILKISSIKETFSF